MQSEIDEFQNGSIEISPGYRYSQSKLVKRIMLYSNGIYPSGKIDKQGNYKFWFDIIQPRVDAEVKNIDFDTKDIVIYSQSIKDSVNNFICNAFLQDWLYESGQAGRLNDAVEEGSGWGNVVWKQIKGDYEKVDLKNFYVINQTAEYLKDSPVIERRVLNQEELRAKMGVWDNVEKTIKECGNKEFVSMKTGSNIGQTTTSPYYEIYERNGMVSTKVLKESQGKKDGDEDNFVLAKITVAGLNKGQTDSKYVLFAEEISEMPYIEYHRGRYYGRWFRKGIIETLFDLQTRANEIGNQIARGLEWSSKSLFKSSDKLIAQNILTDLNNGDIIRSTDLTQVPVRMEGIDQLLADWNRVLQMADRLCNSYEVVTGESLPSGTPFKLGALVNQNANKLFDFIREKLSGSFQQVIEKWILPSLMKDLKVEDVIKITGDSEYYKPFLEMIVNSWYYKNLLAFGPHTKEQSEIIKEQKLSELSKKKDAYLKLVKGWWEGYKPRAKVMISGENVNLEKELTNDYSFINLEQDPVRRTALIELAMLRTGRDVSMLPKSMPAQPQPLSQANAPIDKPII
ncbi:MAG: hypothetical protein WC511_06595 [Candidatus Pacearchaeota archaeon]